jgi:hypothetical protein
MRALGRELKSLTELLSDDHDLALLRDKTIEAARRSRDQAAFDVLLSLIDRRRAELQARARRLGERIYTEKPGAIVDRFQTYWDSWRRDGS